MMSFILDRKNYIGFYVIGFLLRGFIYHFFPMINDILMWMTIVWPIVLIGSDLRAKAVKMDGIKYCLTAFITAALLSTLLHFSASNEESWVSLWNAVSLVYLLFLSPGMEEEKEYRTFFDRLTLAAWALISLMALVSLILFCCYLMNISLPMGLASAERLFTYGHLGEETRFCGVFGYSTVGGNFCALAVLLGIYLIETKAVNRWISFLSIMVLLVTVWLLDVRTSMVELLVCALGLLYWLLRKKLSAGKTAGVMIAGIAVASVGVYVLKQDAIHSFLTKFGEDPEGTLRFLTTGRSVYWKNAFQLFLRNPLFGQGWANNTGVNYFDCHNLLANLLLWTGLAGTFSFAAFLGFWLRCVLKRKKIISDQKILSLSLVILGVFTASMLERTLIGTENTSPDSSFFWLAAGMLAYFPKKSPVPPAETSGAKEG